MHVRPHAGDDRPVLARINAGFRHRRRLYRGAGILIVLLALASWGLLWLIGARQVIHDLLHREAAGISGLEVIAFGLWAFGLAFLCGLGWSLGVKARK